MAQNIHPTAIIEEGALIGPDVTIGPFCHIGPNVALEAEVSLASHVVITGNTIIGKRGRIFSFACLGHIPQDKKYKGEASFIRIGEDVVIREYVTIHPGTEGGGSYTHVGNNCLFMAGVHIAHDCTIGNNVIMSNYATLGGHVVVEDKVTIGGLSSVHQFIRIGTGAMVGGATGVAGDVIPYGLVQAERGKIVGLNLVGLQRQHASRAAINSLRETYKQLFFTKKGTLQTRIALVPQDALAHPQVRCLIDFIASRDQRPLCPLEDFNP